MKKQMPYLLGLLLLAAAIALFVTGNNSRNKQIDERVTLRRQDKIPYGTAVAFKELGHIFPAASIYTNAYEPGLWDSLSSYESGQALVIITGKWNADEDELKKLIRFAENGNEVFVSARSVSYAVSELLECGVTVYENAIEGENEKGGDSLQVGLSRPPYATESLYTYPGKRMDGSFYELNKQKAEILGRDGQGQPNFIRLRAGEGNLFLHLAPLAFSNYFLLHHNNIAYYEKALSVMRKDTRKVVWDDYYLRKKYVEEPREKKKGWFSVLAQYPELKAALFTALAALLVYVLLEMRRKQRIIPLMKKPVNESMDFVKTIGRLYFEKGDHKNLYRKMTAYFLEYVRNRYKLPTTVLDDEFIRNLQYKSGVEEVLVRDIVQHIRGLEELPEITDQQLAGLYRQLEAFYDKA